MCTNILDDATIAHRQLEPGIFNINYINSLEKYLSCPIFQNRPTRTTFQEIINKVKAKLEGWKANCLSKAVRIVLIQSYLESLPAYTMQFF